MTSRGGGWEGCGLMVAGEQAAEYRRPDFARAIDARLDIEAATAPPRD